MKTAGCCSMRRVRNTGGWLVPAVLLAVLPKCPLCFVALFAAATGLGLSVVVAAYLRMALIVLCVAALLFLLIGSVRRAVTIRILAT